MPSLIEGYEYDIFISYRQNDNRYDGWVTEFVTHLKEELEATLKDRLSVYFDLNPEDGLSETHLVDQTVSGKINSLIFIPILSQTYCDPRSFAWNNEFLAFKKTAAESTPGLTVKIPNGNVASRILPIRIHELDPSDKKLLEVELGNSLRPIDFIYKTSGVNRSLRSKDDELKDHANHAIYRNQINKVANAVKDIITGLKNVEGHPLAVRSIEATVHPSRLNKPMAKSRIKKILVLTSVAVLLLLLAGYFIVSFAPFGAKLRPDPANKSIAVLPFVNMSNDPDQEYFSDGMTDQIIANLAKLRVLDVIGRTSVMHYKGSPKTIPEIAAELNNVSYVLEGSIQKSGERIKVNAQLIRAKDNFHQWAEVYDRNLTDIFAVQDELSAKIAQALLGELQPDQRALIKTKRPANVEAYEYYLKGIHFHLDLYVRTGEGEDFQLAEQMFLKAISLDPAYASAYGALADLYDTYGNDPVNGKYWNLRDSIVRIGYKINPKSAYVLYSMGLTYYKRLNRDMDSAFYYFQKAYEIDSDDPIINTNNGASLAEIGLPEKAEPILKKVLLLDPANRIARNYLGYSQWISGDIKNSEINYKKILEIDNRNLRAYQPLAHFCVFYKSDMDGAKNIYTSMLKIDSNSNITKLVGSWLLAKEGKKDEALRMSENIGVYSILNMKKEAIQKLDVAPQPYQWIKNDKLLDFIRDEPEFQAILLREKKIYEERLAKYGHMFE